MPNFKKSTGYKMKGYSYPGTSPLDQLSAANEKANAEPSPFHKKGAGGRSGVPSHGEESHSRDINYEETGDSGMGTDTGNFSKGR